LNVSFVGSSSLAHELGKIDAAVIVTQVVPYPLDENVSIVRDYQTDLRAVDSSALPEFAGLEGYIAARILELALDKIEGQLTREAIVDALEKLGQFDIGLGEPLNLSPNEHQASHRIWSTILKDGGFVPFQWDDIGRLLKNEAQP
jgi:branched-chain amino acid transport system substrate-binding protein